MYCSSDVLMNGPLLAYEMVSMLPGSEFGPILVNIYIPNFNEQTEYTSLNLQVTRAVVVTRC